MGDSKEINIKSSTIEKGLDAAKDFLGKLIMPTVEEAGLLIKDQLTRWRFNNQVRTLNKTKLYCEKHNINTKQISFKLLCPLLDYAGMEENEELQNRWAILLGNLVDSEQNIENHVFPYILSQLSLTEFEALELVYDNLEDRRIPLLAELEKHKVERDGRARAILKEMEEINTRLKVVKEIVNHQYSDDFRSIQKRRIALEVEMNRLTYRERELSAEIFKSEEFAYDSLREFEFSNLVRLGVVKETSEIYNNSSNTLEIPNRHPDEKTESKYFSF